MSRDSRCGILGPLLRDQLVEYLDLRNRQSRGAAGQRQENYAAQIYDFHDSSSGVSSNPPTTSLDRSDGNHDQDRKKPEVDATVDININIGLTSHVGGHVWAGNMIIYIPPHAGVSGMSSPPHLQPHREPEPESKPHPLAGKGIWYGRVEPKHIPGIFEETVVKGRVIKELLRGVVG